MLFSAKAEYACLAMLELAARHGDPKPARLADIADKHGIPSRFLVQILIQLNKAGLVASTRGASGGYNLARPPAEITLADILSVVEGSDPNEAKRSRGGERTADASTLSGALDGVWDRVRAAHREFLAAQQAILKQTTLADLVETDEGLQYVI